MAPSHSNPILLLLFFIINFFHVISAHPLDSLSPYEINQIQATILKTYPPSTHTLSFHYMGLDDPPKPTTGSWITTTAQNPKPNPNSTRTAYIIARVNHTTHEITVDITNPSKITPKILTDNIYHGNGYPILAVEEQEEASNKLVPSYAPFVASINKRGLKMQEIVCLCFVVGWYGEEKKQGRIVKVMCYSIKDTINLYMRPIEGLAVTVDLDEMKVIGFYDREIVPLPKAKGTDYSNTTQSSSYGSHRPPNGVTMVQPDGPSFDIDCNIVR